MRRLDQLLEVVERVLNHPVVINLLMIACASALGLVIAVWLADIRL